MEKNILFTRRSIRSFTDEVVEDETLLRVIKAGMQAPSACNMRPWEFLVTRDKKKIEEIGLSKGQEFIKTGSVAIIVMGTRETVENGTGRWKQDLSSATQNILLQCAYEELGGVWLGYYPDQKKVDDITRIFSLPDSVIPFSVIIVGHTDQENKFIDRYEDEKLHFESYGKRFK